MILYNVTIAIDNNIENEWKKWMSEVHIPDVIATLLNVFVEERQGDELFIDTYQRIGIKPFKERAYAK